MADDPYLIFMRQAFDLWINPEIERRRKAGRLARNFGLHAAQVIMNVDADAPDVRLNEEVRAVLKVRANRRIEKGEALTAADFNDIEGIELTDVDPNAGHLTLLLHKGFWHLEFDFRYNAARISEHVKAAEEFLGGASHALGQRDLRVFVDNLFSAVELAAKGLLLMQPDKSVLVARRHQAISAKYNLWSKLGNTERRFADLLNRLPDLRSSARYVRGDLGLTTDEATVMLAVAEDMLAALINSVPKRARIRDQS